ncbi:MAG: tyrosine-type recombinase/integrase [Acidimicrobiales bacterium]
MYEGAATWYLIPTLGGRKVAALTPADVSVLAARMLTEKSASGRKGLSQRTVQVAVTTLKSATKWAAANGLAGRDPLAAVERPRAPHAEMKTWNAAEARRFLAQVRGDRLEAAWVLLLSRGLRRGELAGLQWPAVDLAAGTITITSTLLSVDGRPVASQPKTSSGRRSIPLDAQLVAILRAHDKAQKAERLRAGEAWQASGYVFVNELGGPYHPDHWSARFDEIVAAAKLPRIRFHDLRHTAFSLMAASGVPLKVVQELAGHSSPAITLSLYVHTVPSMAREAGEALTASLLG